MNPRFVGTLMLIVILACFITGAIVYPHLPLMAISHWNAAGQPDGSMSRPWIAFLFPAIMLVFVGIWALLPSIDPLDGIKRFRRVYDFFFFMIIAFMAYTYALMIVSNLGFKFNFLGTLLPAIALLVFILGSLLPFVKRNWYMGVRTPWTISSEMVWDKTHKLASKLIQIAAIFILVAAFTTPPLTIWLVAVPLIAAALASVVYSYILFAREKAHQP